MTLASPPVLVATRSFHYVDEFGRHQEVIAGQTYVDATTAEAKRFPYAFRAVNGRAISRPVTRSLQNLSAYRPAVRPEANLKPPTEVRMSWKLQRALKEEAALMGDHLECGGFLFGKIEPHVLGVSTRVQILGYSAGSRLMSKRTAGTMNFSRDHLEEALEDPRYVGDWHSHPTRGSFEPSDTDVSGWGARADQVSWRRGRAPGLIGLIVAADEGAGWTPFALQLRAWFVPPLRYDVPPNEREPRPIPIAEVER